MILRNNLLSLRLILFHNNIFILWLLLRRNRLGFQLLENGSLFRWVLYFRCNLKLFILLLFLPLLLKHLQLFLKMSFLSSFLTLSFNILLNFFDSSFNKSDIHNQINPEEGKPISPIGPIASETLVLQIFIGSEFDNHI